jgi:predicted anti-sigma-YlaC factor YlaD
MLTSVPKSDCLQAREDVSARLDGELSELGTARLELHLRDCAECSAYAAEIEAVALRLRATEPERPERPIVLPHRRRLPIPATAAAVAAAAAVAISAAALANGLGSGSKPARGAVGMPADLAGLRADALDQHLFAMLRSTEPQRQLLGGRVIFA